MRFLVLLLLTAVLVGGRARAGEYAIRSPLEPDSLLVAWVIKRHVDETAEFRLLGKGEQAPAATAINTPSSPLRRNARFTAFDAALRTYAVAGACVDQLGKMMKILEITPWRKHEYPEALRFEKELVAHLPTESGIVDLEAAFAVVDAVCSSGEARQQSPVAPDDLAFLGLRGKSWKVVVSSAGEERIIPTAEEPHTFAYDFAAGRLVYVAADKSLRLVASEGERVLLEAGPHGYTQPVFDGAGKGVVLVKLIDGSSINTDIIRLDLRTRETKTLLAQRSTQLDPLPAKGKYLYYANVACTEGCGTILQEIWRKNLRSGQARQLTLLNAISHQPAVGTGGEELYFNSNAGGPYHIWRLSLVTGEYEQLTQGAVTDSFPAVGAGGDLYFLRQQAGRTEICRRNVDGRIEVLDIFRKYEKIRELKVRNE